MDDDEKLKRQLVQQVLKRARIRAVVLGITGIIAILFFVYAQIQRVEAKRNSELARLNQAEAIRQEMLAVQSQQEAEKQKQIAMSIQEQNQRLTIQLNEAVEALSKCKKGR